MKIVVLDGYTENPGDLSWKDLEDLGETTIYDRTPVELVEKRIGDAEIVITNKTPIDKEIFEKCQNIKYVGVLATGYNVVDVNAFACGDGSVRVCGGLMKIMDDDEVFAVIGHEIGHVVHSDSKDAMKNAYLTSAAKNAAGAVSGTVSKLTDSQLGDMAQALAGAQYSQKQEYEADEFGFQFCIDNGRDPYGMSNSLNKLLQLSESEAKSSKFMQMFSSHPETQKRADRVKEKADEYVKSKQ